MRCLAALLCCLGSAGLACSDPDGIFLTCQIEDSSRHLAVCVEEGAVVYRFGPVGVPDLELAEPVETITYQPWPGIGRTIWEELTFRNGDYAYVVHAGVERRYLSATDEVIPVPFGGVDVYQTGAGEDPIAAFRCAPETVDFPWTPAISQAREAAGLGAQ